MTGISVSCWLNRLIRRRKVSSAGLHEPAKPTPSALFSASETCGRFSCLRFPVDAFFIGSIFRFVRLVSLAGKPSRWSSQVWVWISFCSRRELQVLVEVCLILKSSDFRHSIKTKNSLKQETLNRRKIMPRNCLDGKLFSGAIYQWQMFNKCMTWFCGLNMLIHQFNVRNKHKE